MRRTEQKPNIILYAAAGMKMAGNMKRENGVPKSWGLIVAVPMELMVTYLRQDVDFSLVGLGVLRR